MKKGGKDAGSEGKKRETSFGDGLLATHLCASKIQGTTNKTTAAADEQTQLSKKFASGVSAHGNSDRGFDLKPGVFTGSGVSFAMSFLFLSVPQCTRRQNCRNFTHHASFFFSFLSILRAGNNETTRRKTPAFYSTYCTYYLTFLREPRSLGDRASERLHL